MVFLCFLSFILRYCCSDLTASLQSCFVLLTENLLLLVKFLYHRIFQVSKISTNTTCLKCLLLEQRMFSFRIRCFSGGVAILLNVLVSIPDKSRTVIIHLDIFDVDSPQCRLMKFKGICGSVPHLWFF